MVIADHGEGFDPAKIAYGFGLSSIRERLVAVGGRLVIESAPGAGSRFTLSLPLPEPQTTPGNLVDRSVAISAQRPGLVALSDHPAWSKGPQPP